MKKRIVFTVTNELNYDQRMIRICQSLTAAGYSITLVGRRHFNTAPLVKQPFRQLRLFCFFRKGVLFYTEFNLRLLVYLLFCRTDIIGSVDLDTILPGYLASRLRRKQRVYDAHELFCEMKEIVSRPHIYRFWKWVEKTTVPHYPNGYTVSAPIAAELHHLYGVKYGEIRNIARRNHEPVPAKPEKYLIYQGAINEGRSFETLLPAMQWVPVPLVLCGTGNFVEEARRLVDQLGLADKIIFKGNILPEKLKQITRQAWAGITLFENAGRSNYYSLANRFFDYLQAGIPQLCVDYPVYREINNQYPICVLTKDLRPEALASQLNTLLTDEAGYLLLQQNCLKARQILCWEEEEKKLLEFYAAKFPE